MKLPHCDDIPYEVVEKLEADLAAEHPGMKLLFAGDHPDLVPPELKLILERMADEQERLLRECRCMDCHRQMENFSTAMTDDEWQRADGWKHFNDGNDQLVGWQCPECDAKDQAVKEKP